MWLQKLKMCTWEYRGVKKYFVLCVYNFAHNCAWLIRGGNYVATKIKNFSNKGGRFCRFLALLSRGVIW